MNYFVNKELESRYLKLMIFEAIISITLTVVYVVWQFFQSFVGMVAKSGCAIVDGSNSPCGEPGTFQFFASNHFNKILDLMYKNPLKFALAILGSVVIIFLVQYLVFKIFDRGKK